jgi:hypothetical protein
MCRGRAEIDRDTADSLFGFQKEVTAMTVTLPVSHDLVGIARRRAAGNVRILVECGCHSGFTREVVAVGRQGNEIEVIDFLNTMDFLTNPAA